MADTNQRPRGGMTLDEAAQWVWFTVRAVGWPASLNFLSRRMEELKLDATELARVEPDVIRDLQRVCSLCASQRKCRHDLVRNPSGSAWRKYCPNASTLAALMTERANSSKAQ